MEANYRSWHKQLIQQSLNLEEADAVLQIPISRFGAHDRMIWLHSKDGNFTIRLAYHLVLSRTTRSLGSMSNPNYYDFKWKVIWSYVNDSKLS